METGTNQVMLTATLHWGNQKLIGVAYTLDADGSTRLTSPGSRQGRRRSRRSRGLAAGQRVYSSVSFGAVVLWEPQTLGWR
jgi:hypothetical protein